MSGKKYDLSQVSQATKDAYCQMRIDFEISKGTSGDKAFKDIGAKLCREAEVKPKTAREILTDSMNLARGSLYTFEESRQNLLRAIEEALKVMP